MLAKWFTTTPVPPAGTATLRRRPRPREQARNDRALRRPGAPVQRLRHASRRVAQRQRRLPAERQRAVARVLLRPAVAVRLQRRPATLLERVVVLVLQARRQRLVRHALLPPSVYERRQRPPRRARRTVHPSLPFMHARITSALLPRNTMNWCGPPRRAMLGPGREEKRSSDRPVRSPHAAADQRPPPAAARADEKSRRPATPPCRVSGA